MSWSFEFLNDFALYRENNSGPMHNNYTYKYALPFEHVDHPVELTINLQNNWYHSITISVIYFAVIKILQLIMRNRQPFKLRWLLIIWNVSLAIFSIVAFIRIFEDFLYTYFYKGVYQTLCYSVEPHDVAAFWSLSFAWSKIVELGDTLFIVLRKRPLIFLHYYHHAAVLVFTAHSGAQHAGAGRAFVIMNLLAHSLMYPYYACRAYGLKPPRYVAMTITTIQTLQMIAGVFISYCIYRIKTETNLPCQQTMGNLYLGFILYLTFAALFIHFYAKTYFIKPRKLKKIE
uniref:Elongation of very long chain fatty acids protein n=1 Tax=Syphacia muris TaxID=451379 RepID=A0A0N5AF43_9BILA